jgi:hypothetical protein
MRRGFFVSFCLLPPLLLSLCSRTPLALERNGHLTEEEQIGAVPAQSLDLAPLPVQFTEAQARALQELPAAAPPIPPHTRHKLFGFYRGAYNRPLTPREVSFRQSVYELAARHGQFVHVRLVGGKVLTGTIDFTRADVFLLQTDLTHRHWVHYRELAESPRPVFAPGERTVRGLETAGIVVAFIALLPVVLVVYPLIAAGVIQD